MELDERLSRDIIRWGRYEVLEDGISWRDFTERSQCETKISSGHGSQQSGKPKGDFERRLINVCHPITHGLVASVLIQK